MKKRTGKLIDKIGLIVDDIVSNDNMGLEELSIKKTRVEVGLNYLNTKTKLTEDEQEGSIFKFKGDENYES